MRVENNQQIQIDELYKLYSQETINNEQNTLLFLASYTRNGKESYNIYQIKESSSPVNYSSIGQIFDFKIDESYYSIVPENAVYYFGFQSQRLNSFEDESLLDEEIYLTISSNKIVIGSVKAAVAYPDKGTANVSSVGKTVYPVYSATGLLRDVKNIEIQFFLIFHVKYILLVMFLERFNFYSSKIFLVFS